MTFQKAGHVADVTLYIVHYNCAAAMKGCERRQQRRWASRTWITPGGRGARRADLAPSGPVTEVHSN